jgi:hypothetical protein
VVSPDETLAWNELMIRLILATNTSNPAAMRVGAITHVAMFDAFNGVERRYTPIHYNGTAPRGASRRAALIQAAYVTLSKLFPSQQALIDAQRAASVAALTDDADGLGNSQALGFAWGAEVATDILAWRATDGFGATYPKFVGGNAVGQWRSTTSPASSMASQNMAFTSTFVLQSHDQLLAGRPRGLAGIEWVADYYETKYFGSATGSLRTADQTAIAFFWNGLATEDWGDAARQMAANAGTSRSENARLFALLNVALADTAFTTFHGKRSYAADPTAVTWRPITAIHLGDTDGNPATIADTTWKPLIVTPNHPEYPASHPSSHGAGVGILQGYFGDAQAFTLTQPNLPSRSFASISQAEQEGVDARVFGGMHWRSSCTVSNLEGHAVADWIMQNVAQPLHGAKIAQVSHAHGHGDCFGDGELQAAPVNDDGADYLP